MNRWTCNRCGYCCKNMPKLDLTKDEVKHFPKKRYKPYIGHGTSKSQIEVMLYRLIGKRCPLYDEEIGCTIYEDRPLVCKSFPVRENGLDSLCKSAPNLGQPPMIVTEDLIETARKTTEETVSMINEMMSNSGKIWIMRKFKWKVFNVGKETRKKGKYSSFF